MSANVPNSSRTVTGREPSQVSKARAAVQNILSLLADVELHMSGFREYIKIQKKNDKPLYQWDQYSAYSSLSTAVSKLEKAIDTFTLDPMDVKQVKMSLTEATDSSTSVSKAVAYILAIMNKKTAQYLEEMENSTLGDHARASANALITAELSRVLDHSTRATRCVWKAVDVLRSLEQKQEVFDVWAMPMAASVMIAIISAIVSVITTHTYRPTSHSLAYNSSQMADTHAKMLDLFQRQQAITNLTDTIHMMKLEDIDKRYKDLSSLSESHGFRIDNLVDSLGPPNEQGMYVFPAPQPEKPCENIDSRIQMASKKVDRDMKRLQQEMTQMRKTMHRIDIRLTRRLDKVEKR